MKAISIRRLSPRIVNARYTTRALNRLRRQVVLITNSRFHMDMNGKIAQKIDDYTMANTIDVAGSG